MALLSAGALAARATHIAWALATQCYQRGSAAALAGEAHLNINGTIAREVRMRVSTLGSISRQRQKYTVTARVVASVPVVVLRTRA
jgi:hypothetical protein